jgi:hypothetical protein
VCAGQVRGFRSKADMKTTGLNRCDGECRCQGVLPS